MSTLTAFNTGHERYGNSNLAKLLRQLAQLEDAQFLAATADLNWDEVALQVYSIHVRDREEHFAEPVSCLEELVHIGDERIAKLLLSPAMLKGRALIPTDARDIAGNVHAEHSSGISLRLASAALISCSPPVMRHVCSVLKEFDPEFFARLAQSNSRIENCLFRAARIVKPQNTSLMLDCWDVLLDEVAAANQHIYKTSSDQRRMYAYMQAPTEKQMRTEMYQMLLGMASEAGKPAVVEKALERSGMAIPREVWENILHRGHVQWALANLPDQFGPELPDNGRRHYRRGPSEGPVMGDILNTAYRQTNEMARSDWGKQKAEKQEHLRKLCSQQRAVLKLALKNLDQPGKLGIPASEFYEETVPSLVQIFRDNDREEKPYQERLFKELCASDVLLSREEAATWAEKGCLKELFERAQCGLYDPSNKAEWQTLLNKWMDLMASGDFLPKFHPEEAEGWKMFLLIAKALQLRPEDTQASQIARNVAQQAALEQATMDELIRQPAKTQKVRL